jgi:hypothetical protein
MIKHARRHTLASPGIGPGPVLKLRRGFGQALHDSADENAPPLTATNVTDPNPTSISAKTAVTPAGREDARLWKQTGEAAARAWAELTGNVLVSFNDDGVPRPRTGQQQ